MPQLRRASSGLLVLLLALPACRKREEGPEPAKTAPAAQAEVETEAVAEDLPAGAAAVVSAYDLESFWTRVKGTQLYAQLRAIPQVDSLLSPARNPRLAGALQRFQTATGVPLNEQTLFRTFGKKIQVGVYPSAADTTVQRVVLVADMGDKDALTSILANLRAQAGGQGSKFTTEKYKDVDVTVVHGPEGRVRGLYGFHEEKLVAATDQAGIQSAVDAVDGAGQTMERDTLYRRALAHVGDANLTVFVRKAGYRGLVGAVERAQAARGGGQGRRADRMLAVVDKYNVQSALAAGAQWTPEGLLVRSYSVLDPASTGAAPLREMLKTPPSEVEAVGYLPDSTLGFYSVNFLDAPRIYDVAVAYLKEVAAATDTVRAGPAPATRIDQRIALFEQRTGLNIRTDVLGWMGKEASLGLNGVIKGGFFPLPELSLTVQTADPARAAAFFQKLETAMTQAMERSPQGFPVQFQEEDYKGVKVRFAPTPMGEGLAPAYAIHEDYVLVALSRGTLRRMLDVKTGAAQGVRSNPQFRAVGGFYPGAVNVVGYLNTAQLLTEISSVMSTLQQMTRQASPGAQDTLTRVIEALKNVQAVGSYGVNDPQGVEQRFLVKVR